MARSSDLIEGGSQVRLRVLFLLTFVAVGALAQNPDTTGAAAETGGPLNNPNPLTTLASQFFEHDYVNFYGSVAGIVDFNQPILNAAGQSANSAGFGVGLNGGVSLSHGFRDAELSLSYSGGYTWYQNNSFENGTNQYLSLSYAKRLSRRISMNIGVSGGSVLYGSTAYVSEPTASGIVVSNPFSNETRFLGASLGFNFAQSRRLSYGVYGSYFLSRYTFPGSIGTTGVSGGISVNYRLTARTTLSGVYAHSYFHYQSNAGNLTSDQVGVNIGHQFNGHWSVSAYGGVGRSDAVGTVAVPVSLIINGQTVGGYEIGRYNQSTTFPAYSGSVSHSLRRSIFSISAGAGMAGAGNGYLLASKNIYVTGIYSYSLHAQNISFAGTATRLTSIANTVSSDYSSASFSASYGRQLLRHMGAFLRYDYIQYGALRPFAGVVDNRITFGFSVSSRSIPITLF
jgi:hypothetical protein